ncbi:MAG: peptidylprolyl isomerase [Bacteroidetes bacterium]|nr:peptidylprolyl isomerase [Bacteroidia bacterium]PCH69816.1 MAG: peptidylprolyl isomerase [Bacteroidota bacterium]
MDKILTLLLLITPFAILNAQDNSVIDETIAVVGDNYILMSELEVQYLQYASQSNSSEDDLKCQLLHQLLLQKMLITQAEADSIEISEDQIDDEIDRRLRYFINQFGSKEKLEEYYKKSILEIKEEFKPSIKEQLLVQRMQARITSDLKITPAAVKKFYKEIPTDSLPFINAEVEVGQIVKFPELDASVKEKTKQKLKDIREKILNGESFEKMAKLHSEDPGSGKRGGELGFVGRGELVPEFEAEAFKTGKDEVSALFESEFGFHILQLIERRGEQVNVRHILLRPEMGTADLQSAKVFLDSIYNLIKNDSISFAKAAKQFSEDEETNQNAGMLYSAETGTNKIPMDKLDPGLFFQLDTLKTGRISKPLPFKTKDGKDAYRLIFYKSKSSPHRANLKEDYQTIQAAALSAKKDIEFKIWFDKKKVSTFIQVDEVYHNCEIIQNWIH